MATSYLVHASAGSGKTYHLTKAVQDHIRATTDLIVAITFTRAAAAEMQKRILDFIAEDDNIDASQKLHLLMRAAKVRFSTIDALFRQLLATEESSPQIADDHEKQNILTAVDACFFSHSAVIDNLERIVIAARVLQTTPERLLSKLRELDPAFTQWKPTDEQIDDWRVRQKKLASEYARLQGIIHDKAGHAKGNLLRFVATPLLRPLDQVNQFPAVFMKNDLNEIGGIAEKDRDTPVYHLLKKIQPYMRRLLAEYIINSARLSGALLQRFHSIHQSLMQEEKQRRGECFFEDITHGLLELDGTNADKRPALLTRIYERGYDRTAHLLLDEFQDTSGEQIQLLQPLMEDILGNIAPGGAGEKSLFIVGDWKQSIYRWRGAEPDRLNNWLAPLLKNRQLVVQELPYNWRSTPLLINYFNHLTAVLFKGTDYAHHRQAPPPAGKRKDYSGISRILTLPVSCKQNEEALYTTLVEEIIKWQADTGCAWGDIAVLCRTNENMRKIAAALATQGIATSGVRGRELLSLREGVALYLALTALFTPHDGKFIPMALDKLGYDAALQQELERIKEINASSFDPFRFADVAQALRELSRHFPPVLIETVWNDAERYFDSPAPGTPSDWLKHLCDMSPWVTVPEAEHAARVQLATIHGTKGLEFPHVFVLWKEERDRPSILEHPDNGTPLQLNKGEREFLAAAGALKMPSDAGGNDDEADKLSEETANLLYVAATRAISSLTWVLKANKDGEMQGFSERINQAAAQPIADAEQIPMGYQHDYGAGKQRPADAVELPPYHTPEFKPAPLIEEIDPALKSAEIEAGIVRGLRLHAALARLTPECSLPDDVDLTPSERQCLQRFLSDSAVSAILRRPGKVLCEQHVSDTLHFGLVDRLIIAPDKVTIIDYKTGSRHSSLEEQYREQMLRYRKILTALYSDKRLIECFILFVDDPNAIQLS
ncbi:MAG: UvrD-helicase domain-containing protein [Kiritimatiellia bacterium]|jgi:ATP-dependent exoDNAse (exonuclease V) beta subunit